MSAALIRNTCVCLLKSIEASVDCARANPGKTSPIKPTQSKPTKRGSVRGESVLNQETLPPRSVAILLQPLIASLQTFLPRHLPFSDPPPLSLFLDPFAALHPPR